MPSQPNQAKGVKGELEDKLASLVQRNLAQLN